MGSQNCKTCLDKEHLEANLQSLSKHTARKSNSFNNNIFGTKSKFQAPSEFQVKSFIKLQAIYKGISFRKHFKANLRRTLLAQHNKIKNQLLLSIQSKLPVKALEIEPNYKEIIGIHHSGPKLVSNSFSAIETIKIYKNNSFYIGRTSIVGLRNGEGIYFHEENKYSGQWVNDSFTGLGVVVNKMGDIYIGYFVDFMLNTYKVPIGNKLKNLSSIFAGNSTTNSVMSLPSTFIGKKITLSGTVYEGEFKDSLKEGQGREESSEHIYYGQFMSDMKHGIGRLTYKGINDIYEGEFINNHINGKGKYYWANQEIYEGTFINGKMHGKGIYKLPDGSQYIGEYVNNLKDGMGEFKWSNGKIYRGQFIKGKPHGIGNITYKGKTYNCEFKEGKMITSKEASTPILELKSSPFIVDISRIKSNHEKGLLERQSFEEQFHKEDIFS